MNLVSLSNAVVSRRGFVAGLAGLAALGLAGCGPSDSGSSAPTNGAQQDGKTVINLWHSMSGDNGNALQAVVDGFNDSQDTYQVVAANQGTYDESTSKFLGMAGGSDAPAIIQIGEQNLQTMIDSSMLQAASDLASAQDIDTSDLLEQAVNFYTVDGKMWAMPFNCSAPVVYYNKGVLEAAGVSELPGTFEELLDVAGKIAAAKPDVKPVGIYAYGYALDQMVTNMGGYVVNNGNGRESRATEVAYTEQIGKIFDWIAKLRDAGQLQAFSDRTTTLTAFSQGQIALFIDTSAGARGIIDSADGFEAGIAALPVSQGAEPEGVYAGGGALCTASGLSDDVQKGVAAFYTYATSADTQATWAGATGYYPISKAAYTTQGMSDIYAKYPQLEVSADQLRSSKVNGITAGPLCSQLPQLRTDLQTAAQSVFNGGNVDDAISTAVQSTNSAISSANQGVAK